MYNTQMTLIPSRFLVLIGHLSILVALLWETNQSLKHCLPSEFQEEHFQIYQNRLVAGFAAGITLIAVELVTFISGLTMFSTSLSLLSVAAHGSASIVLTYFILDGWLCDWYWLIFVVCSVVPAFFDMITAIMNMCSKKW